jgi:hypothetical protein
VGEKKYTTKEYSKLDKNIWQDLTAYKIIFNFKTDGGIIGYLNKKIFKLSNME